MRFDRVDDFLGIATFGENRCALERMVRWVRPPLVVKVVKQAHNGPLLGIFSEFVCVSTHRRLNRQHMFLEADALCVLANQGVGIGAIHGNTFSPQYDRGPVGVPRMEARNVVMYVGFDSTSTVFVCIEEEFSNARGNRFCRRPEELRV